MFYSLWWLSLNTDLTCR